MISVESVAVSLSGFGSVLSEVVATALTVGFVAASETATTRSRTTSAWSAIVPMLQVTTAPIAVQADKLSDTKVTPAGRASVTVTLAASESPLLVMVMV